MTLMGTERLIIFTRYPEAGQTKTRLIPALGAAGAAQLHRQMTEWTIAQIRAGDRRVRSVEVQFTGGDFQQMQDWLGTDLDYQRQSSGDLGARIIAAIQVAFAKGVERVVVIGTDCPELNAEILEQAFQALRQQDLVIGPATDGGYYLIGLSRLIPELFEGITWGTEVVFDQTIAIAQQLGLTVTRLTPLTDIDRPEDLAIWQQIKPVRPKISVIIPTLNEGDTIASTLKHLSIAADSEVIEVVVVDGGSQDQTTEVAQSCGATVIHTQLGRAQQMNTGAKAASGEILLFLHGDTRLPEDFADQIQQILASPVTIAGAFQLKIEGSQVGLRWVEWGVNWRSRYLQFPYGDQAIFLKAETFFQVGGFPDLPIMEDFELVQRLRQMGRVAIASTAVLTSGRRWRKLGILKTTLINQVVIVAYLLGVSPIRLAVWYRSQGR
jgi:uncharacterized protein